MTTEFKNEHLKPVFDEIIPAIISMGVKYWVYGGVAIAGIKGRFERKNSDVDVFVLENDFENTQKLLENYASKNPKINAEIDNSVSGRPKVDLKNVGSSKDWFSVVPVFRIGDNIEFKFDRSKKYMDLEVLSEVRRSVGNYSFITPPNNYIKELFKHYLKTKRLKSNNKVDAESFLDIYDLQDIFRRESN